MARPEHKAPGFVRQYSFKDAADRGLDPALCKHRAPSSGSLKSEKSTHDQPSWSAVVDGTEEDDDHDLREGEVIDLPAGSFDFDGTGDPARQQQPHLPPTPGASPRPSIPARSPRPRGRSMMDELAKSASQHADLPHRSRPAPQRLPTLSTSLPETDQADDIHSASFDLPSPAWTSVGSPALYAQPDSPVPSDLSRSGSLSMVRPDSPRSRSYAEFGPRRSSRRSMNRSNSSSSQASTFLTQWNASMSANAVSASTNEGECFDDDAGVSYTIGRQIGFGGFSTVHEASRSDSQQTSKLFAVKVVRVQASSSQGEQDIQRERSKWEYEVQLWSKLRHPNILHLDSVSAADGIIFCVMRRASCSLMDLAQRHRSERGLPLHLAKRYICQLASALRYLHKDMKIVHRDVKLENCLICYDESPTSPMDGNMSSAQPVGNLLLCDFGLADYIDPTQRAMPDVSAALEHEDVLPKLFVAGSLPYAAPELLRDSSSDIHEEVFHPAIDIWALGVVAYTMLAGRIPFSHAIEGALVNEILKGQWNRDVLQAVVKVKAKPGNAMFEVVHALDLLHGVLDMHAGSRWGAPQVMSCQFLADARAALLA